MQIRCTQCHKPFALNKEEIHAALDTIQEQELHYFNVHCPHCGRANRVSAQELRRAAPDWGNKNVSGEHADVK